MEEYDWEQFEIACEAMQELQKNITVAITNGILLTLASEDEIAQFKEDENGTVSQHHDQD